MAQSLHSTYSHTQARTHQDELRIHYNAKGLPKRMQLGSQRQKIYQFESLETLLVRIIVQFDYERVISDLHKIILCCILIL